MATPVLPYPDMDFTPLDILTAAEMDQMVANDQYLRDFCAGLADGTNLSDGVIQARKLVPGLSSYSTTERDTGITWVNGKPIYRKCYTGTITITANTRVNVDLEANSPIEDIISVGGCMGYSSGTAKGRNFIPSAESNTSGVMTNFSMVYLVADSSTLRLTRFSNTDRGSQPYAVWVEYTKQ